MPTDAVQPAGFGLMPMISRRKSPAQNGVPAPHINLKEDRMKNTMFAILIIVLLASCTSEKRAEKALLDAGYNPIEVGGYAWFKCAEHDVFRTKFKAYSPDGSREVSGAVCSGWFKGNTIRLD